MGSLRELVLPLVMPPGPAAWDCDLWYRELQTLSARDRKRLRDNLPNLQMRKLGLGGECVCPSSGRSGACGLSSLDSQMVDSSFSSSQLILENTSQLGPGWAGRSVVTTAGWVHITSRRAKEQQGSQNWVGG